MAGNLLQIGSSDGKLRVSSNGLVVAGASDPCCCTPPCSDCTVNQRAYRIRVVLSGITACGSYTAPNGTFDLTFDVGGSPCTKEVDTGIDNGLGTGTTWKVGVSYSGGFYNVYAGFGLTFSFSRFAAYPGGAGDCTSFYGSALANSQTSCAFPNAGYGGTATITAL